MLLRAGGVLFIPFLSMPLRRLQVGYGAFGLYLDSLLQCEHSIMVDESNERASPVKIGRMIHGIKLKAPVEVRKGAVVAM
jgi:hypothetical protein